MTENYFDALVECALLIGVNENTRLKVSKQDSSNKNSKPSTNYQQNILAAISSSVAIFPFSKSLHNYPPKDFKKYEALSEKETIVPLIAKQVSQDEFHIIHDLVNQYNKTDICDQVPEPELMFSINRRNSKFQSRRKSFKPASLDTYKGSLGAISMETIKAFPGTYFNNNLKFYDKYIEPKIEFLPMTDNLGNRSYAFRLEFYRNFLKIDSFDQTENSEGISIQPVIETDIDSSNYIYVPCNVVFFSKYPYFNLFRDILSQLFHSIIHKSTRQVEEELLEYSAILTRIPIMKAENLQITFRIDNMSYSIQPINPIFQQIIDWDMTLLFQMLSLDDILLILLALFQEQKIAFFSQYPNIITLVCETILVLFLPFTWKHFYLTVVPAHLYELVEAIFPFIMGLPSNLKENVMKYHNDIVIVDLDEGSIFIPKGCKIENISKDLINQLKKRFEKRDWLVSRDSSSCLSEVTYEGLKDVSYKANRRFSEMTMYNFTVMMVDLFHEILSHIAIERSDETIFISHIDRFLTNSHSKNYKFFKSIYQSDNFNCFLDSKIRKSTLDGWVEICDQRYPGFLDQLRRNTRGPHRSISFSSDGLDNFYLSDDKDIQVISLPTNRKERDEYFLKVLQIINKFRHIKNIKILEIEIHLQMGNKIGALELIHKTLSADQTSLDFYKIQKLIMGIDKPETISCLSSLKSIVKFDERSDTFKDFGKHNIKEFIPPNVPIPKTLFFEVCRNANITDFESSADCLFRALTFEQKSSKKYFKLVLPELFQCFYDNWIPSSSGFTGDEFSMFEILDEVTILKSNHTVKVDDLGYGIVMVTQMRLLFVSLDNKSILVLVNFWNENITKVKIDRRIKGFGKLSEVLEITKENAKKIVIWLSQDIDIWYNIIFEIINSNRLSIEERDKVIPDKMIEQCLIYETLMKCAKGNGYFKRNRDQFSKMMLTFTPAANDNNKNSFPEHRKYLLSRITPSPYQSVTIDCTLIINKPLLKNFDLWCGLNIGEKYFVRIINIINKDLQTIDSNEIEFMSRIKFMLHLMGTNKIIIVCTNGTVYLMNSVDYAMDEIKIIDYGEDKPNCGVCCYESINCHLVYFGFTSGELFKWNSSYKEIEKVLLIPKNASINFIELYNQETIVIGSTHDLYLASTKGEILSSVEISQTTTILNRISFLSLSEKTVVMGLARLPVYIECNINDHTNLALTRKKNLINNKDYTTKDFSGNSECSSRCSGISSILKITQTSKEDLLWIIYKDGEVEIRNSKTLDKLTTFNAHSGGVSGGMLCDLQNKKVIVTIGKDDGKVILWNTIQN